MSKLPVVSGKECAKALEKIGFYFDHQKGSHMVYKRDNPKTTVTIPDHKEIRKGTLRNIIRQGGLTVDEFAALV